MNDFTHFFLFSFFHAFAADKKMKKMAAISKLGLPIFSFILYQGMEVPHQAALIFQPLDGKGGAG